MELSLLWWHRSLTSCRRAEYIRSRCCTLLCRAEFPKASAVAVFPVLQFLSRFFTIHFLVLERSEFWWSLLSMMACGKTLHLIHDRRKIRPKKLVFFIPRILKTTKSRQECLEKVNKEVMITLAYFHSEIHMYGKSNKKQVTKRQKVR